MDAPRTIGSRTLALSGILAAVGLAACDPFTPPVPAEVGVFAGDEQVEVVGASLSEPLVVRVLDEAGELPVEWEVTAGGGALALTSNETDSDGTARARWW